jgi:hypothetical protein
MPAVSLLPGLAFALAQKQAATGQDTPAMGWELPSLRGLAAEFLIFITHLRGDQASTQLTATRPNGYSDPPRPAPASAAELRRIGVIRILLARKIIGLSLWVTAVHVVAWMNRYRRRRTA